MIRTTATVTSNEKILGPISRIGARTVLKSHLIWFNCPGIASQARPGQFVMVCCGDCTLPRPFSVHQVKNGNLALLFVVWEDGKGTAWLAQRQIGDSVGLLGPLGNSFTIKPTAKNLLLVAGGVGVAPLHSLAQEALADSKSVTLLLGAQTTNQLYPESLLPGRIRLFKATDDGSTGHKGRVTGLIPEFADWADQVFACGPIGMYRDMALRKQQFRLAGKPVQISLEMRMGCGFGVCYGCTVKTTKGLKQACKDGPVFDLDEIPPDEL
ncbi:MAG: dihydroorotate dehydrogenase electron transfer subunit, partial [Dehalococcoidales bacterium]|nr:dihydroorotate dehydrogenase electron transfer subunit [Dehalococcoidales bacterium]